MNTLHGTKTNEDFLRFLSKHFVCIEWVAREWAQSIGSEYANYSGFIISILDNWFLMTAGHNLRNIEEAVRHGVGGSWFLDDTGSKGPHENHIPFDYANADKFWFDQGGVDYAMIRLRPYYRSLLEANGVVALNEKAWKQKVPEAFDHIFLLGIPDETLSIKGRMLNKGYVLSHIELIEECPPELKTPFPRMCGTVAKTENLNSIVGMSGGPIFGLKEGEDGNLRYWVIALQSGWLESKRVIAACPVAVFAEWLDREFLKMVDRMA